MQKTETAADQSIADKPHQCSFLASSAFKLSVFPAPCTYVFTAKTKSSDWLKKCIKKLKNQQTPLFSVFSVITDTSPSLLAQWENWSVRLIHFRRQPSQASLPNVPAELLPRCDRESSFRLPQHSSRAVQVPAGEGFACDAVTVTSRNSAPFPICCELLLSQDTKAGEMSVGCCRNLSGCSRGKITLLKAIQRDPFVCQSSFQIGSGGFYCTLKDSAISDLQTWQLCLSHVLTQCGQQMLQDYISSCTLGLWGDYTFGVKGFRGPALRPSQRDFSVSVKHRVFCQAAYMESAGNAAPKRDFTYGSVRDSFYYNNSSWSNSSQGCNTLQLESRSQAWAEEQRLLIGL